jgi:hypothetical protein
MHDEVRSSIKTQPGHHLAMVFRWLMKVFVIAVILGFQSC